MYIAALPKLRNPQTVVRPVGPHSWMPVCGFPVIPSTPLCGSAQKKTAFSGMFTILKKSRIRESEAFSNQKCNQKMTLFESAHKTVLSASVPFNMFK